MIDIQMPEKKKKKGDWNKIRTDSLLRETSSHYLRLIGDADRKARIMIVVNSILLTISVTLLTKSVHEVHYAWISATLLISANLLTLFFSIVSVKPELHVNIEKETTDNILHYKKCIEYSLPEYKSRVLATIEDDDAKLESLIKEMYFFGNLLNMKYKYLKIAYRVFFLGVVISVISYLIITLLNN